MAEKKFVCYDVCSPAPEVPASAGRQLVPTYREVKPDGKPSYLEYIGDTNVDESIQSFSASVSLADKIARFQSGDTNALFSNGGFYADLTHAPTNLAEAVKINVNLSESYASLPDDVKAVFGDFDEFKKSALTKTFDAKLAKYYAMLANAMQEKKNNEVTEG